MSQANGEIHIEYLRCEYLTNPLGIGVKNPRLSWILKSDMPKKSQTAYQVIVASNENNLANHQGDLWDSGKTVSDQSNQIVYSGKELRSMMKCYWKVRIWDNDDEVSEWSENFFWTMGLLEKKDWVSKWIGAPSKKPKLAQKKGAKLYKDPSQMLRTVFLNEKELKNAYLFVSALGEYEIYVNGAKIGERFLAPEWTVYYKNVQYQTYDVTEKIIDGNNCVGAILADGWFIGHLGPGGITHHVYGLNRRMICQLYLEYKDGTKTTMISNSDWKMYLDGPIRRADHFMGELYDSRKEQAGWLSPDFNDSKWLNAIVDPTIEIDLIPQMNEPIRKVRKLKPISVTEPKPGVFIYNIGQNIAGWCEISINPKLAKSGAHIKLRHGEMLKEDGTLYTKNLREAKATDEYIYSGVESVTWHPRFTYHGFQFVEITGLKSGVKPSLDILCAYLIASDPPICGFFESSNENLNKLWNNIRWTQWDNMISVPTDCPQRNERMGWMGDAQVFCQTSIFNLDMAAFYTKWVKDIRDDQEENGAYPDYIPFPRKGRRGRIHARTTPAWADCGVIIPWKMYLNYGDVRVLEEHYDSMKKYVELVHQNNPELLWKNSTGGNYSDWLNGDTIKSNEYPKSGGAMPKPAFATAYFANSVHILAKTAKIIGKSEESEYYLGLFDQIRQKFVSEFVNDEGIIEGDTQAGYAIALSFDLLPDKLREKASKHMISAIDKYDGRISTGFCSTPLLMLQLSKWNYNDYAYRLLLSHRFPSWFYMIDQGATSMWERWDGFVKGRGFQSAGMNSFNHYSIGAVGEWMYRCLVGINFDEKNPGYKHIIIKPQIYEGITWIKGYYDSLYGRIAVEWNQYTDKKEIIIEIPVNTDATIELSEKDPQNIVFTDLNSNKKENVTGTIINEGLISYKIESGNYLIVIQE